MATTTDSGVQFSYAETFQSKPRQAAARLIERVSGQRRLKKLYDHYRAHPRPGESFWEAAVRLLSLDLQHDAERLAAVPASGPLVVLANHPYGVLDGVVLCALVGRVRPDFKLLVHAALYQAPEAMPHLLPLDFSGGREAARAILRSRAEAMAHLRKGGCLIVFPAGAVATTPGLFGRRAVDGEWGPFSAKLIRRARAAVVPFHFAGQNSLLFQMASHLSYTVRLSLLFHETARRIGSPMIVRIGQPIMPAELAGAGSDEALIAALRSNIDALAAADAQAGPARRLLRGRRGVAASKFLRRFSRPGPALPLLRGSDPRLRLTEAAGISPAGGARKARHWFRHPRARIEL